MQPFPQITDEDVILLTGKEYLIDRIWMEEFGREIEYRYRAVPVQLIYLLRKYGPVIPQGFFVESIQETCGLVEEPENANKTPKEKKRLAEEAALKIIDEAVALGLITRTKPALDQRYQLYRVSGEQLQKLYRIREKTAQVDGVLEAQAADPKNPQAGKTESNKSWCANIVTDMLMRHNDVYHHDKAKLDKLSYLLTGIMVFVVTTIVALAPWFEAAATVSGGTK